jgi:PPK2 family polyphosphate:nucleotide phosphotransferase
VFEAPDNPWRVPYDGSFRVDLARTDPPRDAAEKKELKSDLEALREEMGALQHRMFAQDRWAMLVMLQAMDAGGKDGAIQHVFRGVNPAGLQVFSFKRPSEMELDHDFLWRGAVHLPERGRIAVHNRSWYEEVLVVRVVPGIVEGQHLPFAPKGDALWAQRFESIRAFEEHLARNGTIVLKFWLHLSRDEQRKRFLARLDEPEKNWKFSPGDLDSRDRWHAFMGAYEECLNATSRPHAPWYAIPADDKHYARVAIATVVVDALRAVNPTYPAVPPEVRATFDAMRRRLEEGE